jgi:hypothetical protein
VEPITTTYPRLSKKLYRSLPPIVANAVKQLGEEYRMGQRQITFVEYPEGYVYTAGEGHRIVLIQGERCVSAEMVHSNTVGASGVHYDIGSKTPPLKEGTWLVIVSYYHRYRMRLVKIVQPQLEGETYG